MSFNAPVAFGIIIGGATYLYEQFLYGHLKKAFPDMPIIKDLRGPFDKNFAGPANVTAMQLLNGFNVGFATWYLNNRFGLTQRLSLLLPF